MFVIRELDELRTVTKAEGEEDPSGLLVTYLSDLARRCPGPLSVHPVGIMP
jgi:hypothetical protein